MTTYVMFILHNFLFWKFNENVVLFIFQEFIWTMNNYSFDYNLGRAWNLEQVLIAIPENNLN